MNPQQGDVEAAQKILKKFSCTNNTLVDPAEKVRLREAVLVVSRCSEYQILGICAEDAQAGMAALTSYTKALGYNPTLDLTPIDGAVYIKFNLKTNLCYLNPYSGEYRGVLVACQSPESAGINEMYGHLPLDLFE